MLVEEGVQANILLSTSTTHRDRSTIVSLLLPAKAQFNKLRLTFLQSQSQPQ